MAARDSVRWSVFAGACGATLAVMAVATLPLCGRMFRCGCAMTSAAHCNMNMANMPHCPWCAKPYAAFIVAFACIAVACGACVLAAQRRARRRFLAGWAAGVLCYAIAAPLAGYLTARAAHYPMWFGLHV
jgi:hypothetical protein